MRLHVSSAGQVALESARVTLRGLTPMLNGVRLDGARLDVRESGDGVRVRMTAPGLGGGRLDLTGPRRDADAWDRRHTLASDPGVESDSIGVCCEVVEDLRASLQAGYYSWGGSRYLTVVVGEPRAGYAMTQ